MTAKELSEKLANLPPDMPVLVDGYEGGLDNINSVHLAVVYKVWDTMDGLMGEYDELYDGEREDGDFKAFVLSRA